MVVAKPDDSLRPSVTSVTSIKFRNLEHTQCNEKTHQAVGKDPFCVGTESFFRVLQNGVTGVVEL